MQSVNENILEIIPGYMNICPGHRWVSKKWASEEIFRVNSRYASSGCNLKYWVQQAAGLPSVAVSAGSNAVLPRHSKVKPELRGEYILLDLTKGERLLQFQAQVQPVVGLKIYSYVHMTHKGTAHVCAYAHDHIHTHCRQNQPGPPRVLLQTPRPSSSSQCSPLKQPSVEVPSWEYVLCRHTHCGSLHQWLINPICAVAAPGSQSPQFLGISLQCWLAVTGFMLDSRAGTFLEQPWKGPALWFPSLFLSLNLVTCFSTLLLHLASGHG